MRNKLLDQNRFIASILVIILHAPFPGVIGSCIECICRISVPFFFMVAGYHSGNYQMMPRKIKRTFILLMWSVGLYFCWNVIYAILQQNIVELMNSYFSIDVLFETFIFNSGLWLGHLWFVLALLYCYIICFEVRDKWSRHARLVLIIVLLVAHFILREILEKYNVPNSSQYIRNFLFMGLPYFLLGEVIADGSEKLEKISKNILLGMFLLGIGVSVIERLCCGSAEMYCGTVLLALAYFLYSLNRSNPYSDIVSELGKSYASDVYIFHVLIISGISIIASFLGILQKGWFLWMKPIIIIVITIGFVVVKDAIQSKVKNMMKED